MARAYKPRRFRRRLGTFGGAASALKLGYRAYKSYTKTSKKRPSGNYGVTNQHDVKTIYRKKFMPKYKKRKWISFVKKVNAVTEKQYATQTVLFNQNTSKTNTAGNQDYMSCWLYGRNGDVGAAGSEPGITDLATIFNTVATQATERLIFKSAVLDLTITNNASVTCEVDIYHVRLRKDDVADTFVDAVQKAEFVTGTLPTYTSLIMTKRGCTPFEFPTLISNIGMSILKKTKIFMPGGGTSTYQLRDPRQKRFGREDVVNDPTFIMPYHTQGLIIMFKPVAGLQDSLATLNIGVTRKFSFIKMDKNYVQDGAMTL